MEKIFLKTSDNVRIAGNYLVANKEKYGTLNGWIVFLHMMPETKEAWQEFGLDFQSLGYESLAIDFRGHGESQGGPKGFMNFSDSEHQKSIFDVEAVVEFLKTKGAKSDKITFIGASIGANLALQYISKHPEFKSVILFSPGFDYRGIETEQAAKKLQPGQKVFLISSKDDGVNSTEAKQIFEDIPGEVKKEIQIFDFGGHGTEILGNHPELKQLIIKFIKQND